MRIGLGIESREADHGLTLKFQRRDEMVDENSLTIGLGVNNIYSYSYSTI